MTERRTGNDPENRTKFNMVEVERTGSFTIEKEKAWSRGRKIRAVSPSFKCFLVQRIIWTFVLFLVCEIVDGGAPNINVEGDNLPDPGRLVQELWRRMDGDVELATIFGKQIHKEIKVPNVDIVNPIISSSENIHVEKSKGVRTKRSIKSRNKSSKFITFQGLGNTFNCSLEENTKLLDPHFAHLVRDGNQTNILSPKHVATHNGCFYQGRVTFVPLNPTDYDQSINRSSIHANYYDNDVNEIQGIAALSVCKGLRGVIIGNTERSDKKKSTKNHLNDNESDSIQLYFIHPVPKHILHEDDTFKNRNTEGEPNVHFLWRKSYKDLKSTASLANSLRKKLKPLVEVKRQNLRGRRRLKRATSSNNAGFIEDIFSYHKSNGNYRSRVSRQQGRNDIGDSSVLWYPSNNPYYGLSPDHGKNTRSTSATMPSQFWIQEDNQGDQGGEAYGYGRNTPEISKSTWDGGNQPQYDERSQVAYENGWTSLGVDSSGRTSSSVSIEYEIMPARSIWASDFSRNDTTPLNGISTYNEEQFDIRRKGRKDNRFFGDDWSSSLDKMKIRWSGGLNEDLIQSNEISRRHDEDYFGGPQEGSSNYNLLLLNNEVGSDAYGSPSNHLFEYNEDTDLTPKVAPEIDYDHNFRDLTHLTIETAVFVDKDLFEHMESNFPEDTHTEVTRIVLAMINAVQLLYQDPSLGHRIEFVLKRLEVLKTDPPGLRRPYDIDRYLTNFCKWQRTQNPSSDADPIHWDHALILTGLDLYVVHKSGKISNQVVGLAPVSGMCTRSSSCTVNEGRHFESVFVISHEIGHNLGMRHDGAKADNRCDPTSHIMSPTLGSGKITWSQCSRKYLELFLKTNQAKCLFDKAASKLNLDHHADGRLPGERFDADKQCILKYGRGSYHATQQPMEDVCRDLHCRRDHFTWTSHPALEGTYCGPNMWCRSGKCMTKESDSGIYPYGSQGLTRRQTYSAESNHIYSNRISKTAAYSSPIALNGNWGNWSLFTDCASSCLQANSDSFFFGSVGIQLAVRRCDSPRPENGGRHCTGPDKRYKACHAYEICKGSGALMSIETYADDVCRRASVVDTELTGRGYMKQSDDEEAACSVWCETSINVGSRSRGWSFPDGTSCKLSNVDRQQRTYCVAGKCKVFSCGIESNFQLSDYDCKAKYYSSAWDTNVKDNDGSKSWFGRTLREEDLKPRRLKAKSALILPSKKLMYKAPDPPQDYVLRPNNQNYGYRYQIERNTPSFGEWMVFGSCKMGCIAPGRGMQIIKRKCSSGQKNSCSGNETSIQLCNPSPSEAKEVGCERFRSPFEYATNICSKYAKKISGLSGIGMQLSKTDGDENRACQVGCQDSEAPYRFYMVNGQEGWFPAGTECSGSDSVLKSYCIGGKCINFQDNDQPLESMITNLSSLTWVLHDGRSKRSVRFDEEDWKVNKESPIIIGGWMPLKNMDLGSYLSTYTEERSSDTDLNVLNGNEVWRGNNGKELKLELKETDKELIKQSLSVPDVALEGSYYEWETIISDCSRTCGRGYQQIVVRCKSGETTVGDNLCSHLTRPGYSQTLRCNIMPCLNIDGDSKSSYID